MLDEGCEIPKCRNGQHTVAHFREFNLINEYFQSINSDVTNFTLPHKITAP